MGLRANDCDYKSDQVCQVYIFFGDKNNNLASLKSLLISKTKWTDYMEYLLHLIAINLNEEVLPMNIIMNQESFPYCICDISLPQYNTGYVYMLVSFKYFNY